MLIKLDAQQKLALSHPHLRPCRLLARILLTQWKITRPRQFEAWNFWRVANYQLRGGSFSTSTPLRSGA